MLITFLIICLNVSVYSQNLSGMQEDDITNSAKHRITGNSFHLIKATQLANAKLSVDIRLTGSRSKSNMESIYQIIKKKYPSIRNVFVTFYTNKMIEMGAGCYAIRHSSDGKVIIHNNYCGKLAGNFVKHKKNSSIIGRWRQNICAGVSCTYALKKVNSKYKMYLKYSDGSGSPETLIYKGNGIYRVICDGEYEDEYYKLSSSGVLSIRDSYGSCIYLQPIE